MFLVIEMYSLISILDYFWGANINLVTATSVQFTRILDFNSACVAFRLVVYPLS